jgi:magnesium-transporting ATPase (P-type)
MLMPTYRLTSGPPAFGLGLEKAVYNIMQRPPHDTKKGVFSWQIIADMVVYGMIMGILTLVTFVIVIYGVGDGNLGHDCNRTYSADCDLVFRARAVVFAELTWLIMVSAWEIKSIRRSLFRLDPRSTSRFPLFKDLYDNKFLFYAVVIGALIVFPCVYIPGFNTTVFKQKPITWEWALAVGAVGLFVAGMEAWKFCKRRFGWFADDERDPNSGGASSREGLDLRQGFFSFARTLSKSTSFGKARGRESDGSAWIN